jgi:hypothetical protein
VCPFSFSYRSGKADVLNVVVCFHVLRPSLFSLPRAFQVVIYLFFVASQVLQSVLTAIYVIAGVVGSVIIIVVIVCIAVHFCQRCRRSKNIDVTSSSSSAHVSPTVDCQYVTLQTNEVNAATPSAPPTEYDFLSADNLNDDDSKPGSLPPSYEEVAGLTSSTSAGIKNARCESL